MSFDLQTYRLADVAREKLWHEAARPDHNLHQLMLHANLLDDLLAEIKALESSHSDEVDQKAVGGNSLKDRGGDAGIGGASGERTRRIVQGFEDLINGLAS